MKRCNQRGVALLITLILVLVLTVMTVSMMFLAQSETWSSSNYRSMTQARYGAEAGLHAAANYLINPTTGYPGIGTSDPFNAYTTTGSPVTVTANGNPVVLSTLSGVSSNYPVAAVKTAYASASTSGLNTGANTVNYTTSAQLLGMKQFQACGNAQMVTTQLWKLTSHGDITGVRNAEEEVSALLESHAVSCYQYAAYATSSGCGAINWSGGGPINSYDSSNLAAGTQGYGGNVGSNGNGNLAPHTSITGQFSSPETGVGACSSGDALSGATPSTVGQYVLDCENGPPPPGQTDCGSSPINQLSQSVQFTAPNTSYPTNSSNPTVNESSLPSSSGNLSPNSTTACPAGGSNVGCYGDISNSVTLMPYWNGIANGQPGYSCGAATYYINTLTLNGSKTLTVGTCPDGSTQPIILNIVDVNNSGSPLTIGGGSVANASMNPADLQIQYAGTGSISIHGGSSAAAVLFAPNAPVTLNGANSDWYGSLISSTLTLTGNGASIHYDRRLANTLMTLGNWTMDTFTWSKY